MCGAATGCRTWGCTCRRRWVVLPLVLLVVVVARLVCITVLLALVVRLCLCRVQSLAR